MIQLKDVQEITPNTLAILSRLAAGRNSVCILEDTEEIFTEYSPSKLMDYACKFFGSSLRGRQEGTADVCKITHKAPIAVNPSSGMYFFPTASPSHPDCSWIAHSHIADIQRSSSNFAHIIFKNGVEITIPVSHGIIMNQVQRTAHFRYLLEKRIWYVSQGHAGHVAEPFA